MAVKRDLAALPVEVRIPRLNVAMDFVVTQTFYVVVCSAVYACQSVSLDLYASPCHPGEHKRQLDSVCAAGA